MCHAKGLEIMCSTGNKIKQPLSMPHYESMSTKHFVDLKSNLALKSYNAKLKKFSPSKKS